MYSMASAALCCVLPSHELLQLNMAVKRELMHGNPGQSILTYVQALESSGFHGDNFTFPVLLKAACSIQSQCIGAALHGQVIKSGFSIHSFVQTSLINMYSDFGNINAANSLFERMKRKDLVAWNCMLNAYTCCGQMDEAMELFDSMPVRDQVSFNTLLSGYATLGMVDPAEEIFFTTTSINKDVISYNTMLSLYVKAGKVMVARKMFDSMPERNVVSWNTLLSGYLQCQHYMEVVELFYEMELEEAGFIIQPDHTTIAVVLSAIAHLGSLNMGRKVHSLAGDLGLGSEDPHVAASLIDMYAKCGSIEGALGVFYKTRDKDIYCWNSMISGLALHGHGRSSIKLFDDMQRGVLKLKPDDITFIGLLSACSHAGLVNEGCHYFDAMAKKHGLSPKWEHYGCMIDLLSRAGHLTRAYEMIEGMMPFENAGSQVLGALLAACIIHRDLEMGEAVANRIAERTDDRLSDGEYMMVANMYAACGRVEEAGRWRKMMNDDKAVTKTAGWSMVEVGGRMHRFLAGGL